MQLKELLRFKLISLQWRCRIEEKRHLRVNKDVVVIDRCVVNVVKVVFRQKRVFFVGRLWRLSQPFWIFGTVVKQQQKLATYQGKLARFYKQECKSFIIERFPLFLSIAKSTRNEACFLVFSFFLLLTLSQCP